MGVYVYRVTAQRVVCSDGKEANVAKFAYKPCSDEKWNRKWDFQTGCATSRALARDGKLTDRVTTGSGVVYGNPHNWGTFIDDYNLGTCRMPRLDVKAPEIEEAA